MLSIAAFQTQTFLLIILIDKMKKNLIMSIYVLKTTIKIEYKLVNKRIKVIYFFEIFLFLFLGISDGAQEMLLVQYLGTIHTYSC